MEPRPFERGNKSERERFAGRTRGFNGATSFRTWKRHTADGRRTLARWLQWSHVLSNVETGFSAGLLLLGWLLQWSHVLSNVETSGLANRLNSLASGFNGATSFRTWKHGCIRYHPDSEPASMEPRPFERGNTVKENRRRRTQDRFNGATSFRTWKQPKI